MANSIYSLMKSIRQSPDFMIQHHGFICKQIFIICEILRQLFQIFSFNMEGLYFEYFIKYLIWVHGQNMHLSLCLFACCYPSSEAVLITCLGCLSRAALSFFSHSTLAAFTYKTNNPSSFQMIDSPNIDHILTTNYSAVYHLRNVMKPILPKGNIAIRILGSH